jgi:hypothetical protein
MDAPEIGVILTIYFSGFANSHLYSRLRRKVLEEEQTMKPIIWLTS